MLTYSLGRRERLEAHLAGWTSSIPTLRLYLALSASLLLALRPTTPLWTTLALLPAWHFRGFFWGFAALLWPPRLDVELELTPSLVQVRIGSGETLVNIGGTHAIVGARRRGGLWLICFRHGEAIPVPDRLLSDEQRALLAGKGG